MEETARKIKENELCWYVAYTMSKAERKVKERLDKAGVETYLPLQSVVRLWNDRKKQVSIPVIPGCIFVRVSTQDISTVSTTQGVTFLLKEAGQFASISNEQMDTFKRVVEHADNFVEFASASFQPGVSVRIARGQLKGLVGELVDCQGCNKLMLRIDGLGYALVAVPVDCVERCWKQ